MASDEFQDRPGLVTNKLGSFTENQGVDIAPASSVLETTDWFGPTKTLARAIGNTAAMYGTVDEFGRSTSEPEEYVDPKTLNEKFSLPNHPAFDKAMPLSVAQGIYDHRLDEDKLADAAARRPEGFWHSAATMGTQFVADALDPLNIAATFVPGVGEAKFVAEGAGTVAKVAGRAAAGAINADIGQIPLVGMKYAQSKFEQDDYNAYNAMLDLATGAGMGALFHVGIGAFADRLQSRVASSAEQKVLEANPGLREATLKTALAQQLGDNDVEVRPLFDSAGLKAATDTRDAFLDEAAAVGSIAPGSRAATRITEIDAELAGGGRLAAIDQELTGAIDPARRAQLEAERRLVEANPVPLERVGSLMKERNEIVALEEARSVAQQEGLLNAAERSEAEIQAHLHAKNAEHYAELEKMVKEAGGTVADAYAATASHGDASLEELERAYQQTRSARAESQGAAAGQRPNAPAANQAAGAAGVVDQQRAAQPGAAGAEAGGAGQGAGSAGAAGAAEAASPSANRGSAGVESAQQEALRAADGKPTATQQKITEAATIAGKSPVKVDKMVQAAADQIQDHMAFLQHADAMGALSDADRAALQALGQLDEESNGLRKAAGQAAMCIARGLG